MCNGIIKEKSNAVAAFGAEKPIFHDFDCHGRVPFAGSDFTKKLSDYRKGLQEENRQEFSARTDGVGLTHTFWRELKKFCDGFLPHRLRMEKRLWLTMDDEGRF